MKKKTTFQCNRLQLRRCLVLPFHHTRVGARACYKCVLILLYQVPVKNVSSYYYARSVSVINVSAT